MFYEGYAPLHYLQITTRPPRTRASLNVRKMPIVATPCAKPLSSSPPGPTICDSGRVRGLSGLLAPGLDGPEQRGDGLRAHGDAEHPIGPLAPRRAGHRLHQVLAAVEVDRLRARVSGISSPRSALPRCAEHPALDACSNCSRGRTRTHLRVVFAFFPAPTVCVRMAVAGTMGHERNPQLAPRSPTKSYD